MSTSRFKDCALLLIDLQTQWTVPCMNGDFPELKDNLQKLVKFARNHGMLVVHIFADYNEQDSRWFDTNDERQNTLKLDVNKPDFDMVKPMKNERTFYKSTFDAFYKTTLHEYLESKGIKTVYGAGVATSVCVLNSMHGAYIRGYKTYIVKDCCADSKREYHDYILERYLINSMLPVANIADNLECRASKL